MEMTSDLLAGKVALIAGMGSGIGSATARTLAAHGADIGAIDLAAEPARSVIEALRIGGRQAELELADLMNDDQITDAVAALLSRLGRVDSVVTVAGGMAKYGQFRRLHEWGADDWDAMFSRNLRYIFMMLRAAIKHMVAQGDGGAIVAVSSISGIVSAPNHAAYGAAKAGINNLVRSLAGEYASDGIRVNAVAAGAIETEAVAQWRSKGLSQSNASHIPLGRLGSPGDIASAILYFASPLSNYVTGQTLLVDGGASIAWPLAQHPPGTPAPALVGEAHDGSRE
jgi:3-oxoacyl-[acyl-carrier protein] reductase